MSEQIPVPVPVPASASQPEQPQGDNKVIEYLQRLEKQFNFLTAKINAPVRKETQATQATEKEATTLEGLRAEIMAERDARDAKLRERAIRSGIDEFCKANNIPEKSRPFLKAYLRQEYGEKITVDEDDNLLCPDEIGTLKPFGEIGKKILLSEAATLLPPVQTPGGVGNRNPFGASTQGGAKPVQEWTGADWDKNEGAGIANLQALARAQQRPNIIN